MSFPGTWREIKEMALDSALDTEMARKIVRKAGLKQGASVAPVAFERTLVAAWIYPKASKENWQWEVDLTGFSAIRFVSRGVLNPNFFLVYSLAGFGSQVLDPGDYLLFTTLWPLDPYGYPTQWLEAYSGNSEIDGGNPWAEIPPALRVPMRLSLSVGTAGGSQWNWTTGAPPSGWGSDNYAGGFSVGVQVR